MQSTALIPAPLLLNSFCFSFLHIAFEMPYRFGSVIWSKTGCSIGWSDLSFYAVRSICRGIILLPYTTFCTVQTALYSSSTLYSTLLYSTLLHSISLYSVSPVYYTRVVYYRYPAILYLLYSILYGILYTIVYSLYSSVRRLSSSGPAKLIRSEQATHPRLPWPNPLLPVSSPSTVRDPLPLRLLFLLVIPLSLLFALWKPQLSLAISD